MKRMEKLFAWRDKQAKREGVDSFRVLPNATLSALASVLPQNRDEFLSVRGFKEGKWRKYGPDLLKLMKGENDARKVYSESDFSFQEPERNESSDVFTVGEYLDAVNATIRPLEARVRGEVIEFGLRHNYVFFSLKDEGGGKKSVLECFMWRSDLLMCGVELEEGMEVVISGYPEVYVASGKFSFRTGTVELVGEGALKKSYEKLRARLEEEGIFNVERKRKIPDYPHKIGLITSREGAVIHDFLSNLGQYGFQIRFMDVRVEGQSAVKDLVGALRVMRMENVDVVVLIRGGGSLESLQAFNNETLVREIIEMPMPVVCGIGHHEDAPLATLAADIAVSTPTAVASEFNRTWDRAAQEILRHESNILQSFRYILEKSNSLVKKRVHELDRFVEQTIQRFSVAKESVVSQCEYLKRDILGVEEDLKKKIDDMEASFQRMILTVEARTRLLQKSFHAYDPRNILKRGYTIISSGKKVLSSKDQCVAGDILDVAFFDGNISVSVLERKRRGRVPGGKTQDRV